MSRILIILAAIAPTSVLAHAGSHDVDATGTVLHSVSQPNHAFALIAALTLPIAAAILIRKRFR